MSKKYFIISDLHLEFRQKQEKKFWEAFPSTNETKVLLCAGDLTCFGLPDVVYYRHFTALCNRFDKIIYVPGNHEYYGSDPKTVEGRLVSIERDFPSITILRAGQPYTFDGQRFIGDTMWFPDRPEVHIYRKTISDSFQIMDFFPWCFTQSNLFISSLKNDLREDDIVISHHVPTDVDTNKIWKDSPTQSYFLNVDSERYLNNSNTVKPKAWIYGHTHDKHDYQVGRTHFVCNPLGYPNENGHLPEAFGKYIYEL